MADLFAVVLLLVCFLAGLVLVPLGLPGLWVMALGVIGYGWLTEFRSVGIPMIAVVVGVAFVGEVLEAWIGFRMAQRYGGSRRAGWGALLGGIVGAVVGVPVPIVGSVLGALVGSFVGAAAIEYLNSRAGRTAIGAGWGAVLGRAVAAAAKVGLGLVIGVIGLYAVFAS